MKKIVFAMLAMMVGCGVAAARENITRGLVALPKDGGRVFLGWRCLLNDRPTTAFNVYRSRTSGTDYVLLNPAPISDSTNYVDESSRIGETYYYVVKPVNNAQEGPASNEVKITAAGTGSNVITIPLHTKSKIGRIVLVDLNGDGLLDFVVMSPGGNKDPSMGSGVWSETNRNSETFQLSAYLNDGTFLWSMDLGWGIEFGVHYSPYTAWDIDGDGKAEVLLKTMKSENPLDYSQEYLTVLDGMTGKVKKETRWIGPVYKTWHDKTGVWTPHEYGENSRNYIGIAYLDGTHPFIIIGRGTYGCDHPTMNTYLRDDKYARMFPTSFIVVAVYDADLNKVWERDFSKYDGKATHGFDVADLDDDGQDEILWGDMCIDSNGNSKWSSPKVPYVGHPDYAMIADIIPSHPGLEILNVREGHLQPRSDSRIGTMVLDKDGKILWEDMDQMHVHSGMMAKFSNQYEGMQITTRDSGHSHEGLAHTYMSDGAVIDTSFVGGIPVRWDYDTKDKLYQGNGLLKDYDTGATTRIGSYGSVRIVGDILGDSREEMAGVTEDGNSIYILTNTDQASQRSISKLYDREYREGLNRTGMEYQRQREAFMGGYIFADQLTDERLPEVKCLSHRTGDAIKGLAVISGTVESGKEITSVICRVDGKEQAVGQVNGHTWSVELNTSKLPEGTRAVEIQVTDAGNHHASAFRQLIVDNDSAPEPSVTNPAVGAVLSGRTVISGAVAAQAGAATVELFLDTTLAATLDARKGSWSWTFDTSRLTNGPHVLRVVAYDAAQQYTYKDVTFSVNNPGHEFVVYDDRMAVGWEDRSYAADCGGGGSVLNFRNKTPVHGGQVSIAWKEAWLAKRALYLYSNTPVDLKGYHTLEFYVYGRRNAHPGALIELFDVNEEPIEKIDLWDAFPEGKWTRVSIPLDKFKGAKGGLFSGIYIQPYGNSVEQMCYIDDITLK